MVRLTGAVSATALVLAAGMAASAEQETKRPASQSADKVKIKGRLPMYFGQIGLSPKQEQEMRQIALPFDEKLSQLRKQIEELEKLIGEQEAAKLSACEKLLSEGQRSALKERRETAAAERLRRATKKAVGNNEKQPEQEN